MDKLLIDTVLMAYQRIIEILPRLSDTLSKDVAKLEDFETRDPDYDVSNLWRLDNERALLRDLRIVRPYLTSGHGLLSSIVAQKLEDLPLGAVIEKKNLSTEKILKDIDKVNNNLIARILELLKDSFAMELFDLNLLDESRNKFHIVHEGNLFFSYSLKAIQKEEEILRKEEILR